MTTPRTSLRAAYAKHVLNKHLLAKLNDVSPKHYETLGPAPEFPENLKDDHEPYQGRVCIIGAGAAGLYTAMMLKYLGATNVDILEGNTRVGGRCFTQPLPSDAKSLPGATKDHNYYDVGAMRIPDIPWMQQ